MKTSSWQTFRFAFIYINSQPTAYLIAPIIGTSAYLGWAAILVGGGLSLIPLWCSVRLGMYRPDQAWLDFGEEIVGKWPHRLVLALLVFWAVLYVSTDIESFTLFYGSNYMRETPQWFIHVMTTLVIIFTARRGFATLVYMSDGLFFLTLIMLVLVLTAFFKDADIHQLTGLITHRNFGSAAKDSIFVFSFLGEWLVFLFIAPYLQIGWRTLRNLASACILVTIAVTLQWLLTFLSFGPHLGKLMQYPLVELIRSSVTGLLGNTDPLLIGLWSTSMFIHSAFLLQVGARCLAKILRVQQMHAPLITVLGGTAAAFAYQFSRNPTLYQINFNSPPIVLFWVLVLFTPVYYWIVLIFRRHSRKRKKPKNQPNSASRTAN
ncbi:GerAB/ArcD/ProY family transporter [Paenibacillus sp. DMB20]|uniref:GerAB/ArcD/ProY family transporter n=1 Tax=Paenibacillus sp. DMB20 TaxID=1642570 RepID=UPI0006278F6D|nr:GerAB/ArcD/ProY family transporter [Paenibacillus sp. DMB20]KKO53657.1 spore gernimation protein [Paenibacillus sp. DMB20]